MKIRDNLSDFVQAGLQAGHSGAELRGALQRAGWPDDDIDAALSVWIDDGLRLPVPRPRPSVSGRELVMFGLFAITLLMVVWHVVHLAFALIDLWLPDPEYPWSDVAHDRIRWSAATLLVVLPLFVWLTWRIGRPDASTPEPRRSILHMRFAALAVLGSILGLIGNAVVAVYTGLSGDLTLQFLAKAAVVTIVATVLIVWFRGHAREV